MTSQPGQDARPPELPRRQADRERAAVRRADVALRSMGQPNAIARQFDFADDSYEWRRLFSEVLGTFFLVLVAVGGGMVNTRFGGHAVPAAARVTAPALMVAAIILFMGTVSGAHLNPVVSAAFALRGDFPWKRVPTYIVAQFAGAVLATLLLWALIGRQGSAGLTLPGSGISTITAMLWEAVLTAGLVSVILGTASGAQAVGSLAAIAVASYIALAGLWGSAGQRRLDEPGQVARARPGAWRLDRLVGVPGRAGHRRRHRGRHRLCAARAGRRAERFTGGRGHARPQLATGPDRPLEGSSGRPAGSLGSGASRGSIRSCGPRSGTAPGPSRPGGSSCRSGDSRRRPRAARPGSAAPGRASCPP